MVAGSPWISSALLHLGVLLALWVSFAPKAFDSLYSRPPLWIETDQAVVGISKERPAARKKSSSPQAKAAQKTTRLDAARELKEIAQAEAAPTIPTRGRAGVE